MFVDAAREIVKHVLRRALLPYGDTADDGVRFRIVVKEESKFCWGHIHCPLTHNFGASTVSKISMEYSELSKTRDISSFAFSHASASVPAKSCSLSCLIVVMGDISR